MFTVYFISMRLFKRRELVNVHVYLKKTVSWKSIIKLRRSIKYIDIKIKYKIKIIVLFYLTNTNFLSAFIKYVFISPSHQLLAPFIRTEICLLFTYIPTLYKLHILTLLRHNFVSHHNHQIERSPPINA